MPGNDDDPPFKRIARAGDWVRAKRACWNEVLTPEQLWDLDPCECTDDHELEGELDIRWIPSFPTEDGIPDIPGYAQFNVDGHSCDPETIEVIDRSARHPRVRRR